MDELKSLETTRLRRPAARGALGRSFPHLVYGEARPRKGGRAGIRLPLGVLGMIALIGVVETAIALAAPRLRDPVSFSWVYAAEAGKHRTPGSAILCLGDSLAKDGLVSAVLTATTGVPTYNLSAPAAPAPMTECLFRRALDAGAASRDRSGTQAQPACRRAQVPHARLARIPQFLRDRFLDPEACATPRSPSK